MEKSKVLIIGATGNMGYELAKASLELGHPTYALVRETAFAHPEKSQKLQTLANGGAHLLKGCLEDLASLVEAIRLVDVVISAVSAKQVPDQISIIEAIKKAGSVKRFLPAEFGVDSDKIQIGDLGYRFYSTKSEMRRIIEAEGIPYTYICCNLFASYLLPSLAQPGLKAPPRDKVRIFGDGDTKAVFVKESDVAAFTINTIDDPTTLNKVLYLRPPGNVCSMNELVDIWEKKIGNKLEKIYVTEEHILKTIQDISHPDSTQMVFIYSAFIKGDHTYFDMEPAGVDGVKLYPHVKYTTVSEYLDNFL